MAVRHNVRRRLRDMIEADDDELGTSIVLAIVLTVLFAALGFLVVMGLIGLVAFFLYNQLGFVLIVGSVVIVGGFWAWVIGGKDE